MKRKNVYILLILIFPLLLWANNQTPKEIVKSKYELIIAKKYKEAMILDSQHSKADYQTFGIDFMAKKTKESYEKKKGLKKINIISEKYLNENTAIVSAELINGNGTITVLKLHYIKENKTWKESPSKSIKSQIEKQTPKNIVKPIIENIIKGNYKEAALLEIQHSINSNKVDDVVKKYKDEYNGKLNGLKRYDMSQKSTKTRKNRVVSMTSLVTVFFVFNNGTEAEMKYHLIEDDNSFWKIIPEKTTSEWNIIPDSSASKKNNIKSSEPLYINDLYEIHLSENVAKPTDIINLHLNTNTVTILSIIILVITILMHILRRSADDEGFEGLMLPTFFFLFIGLCILELIIVMSGINPLWFCSPNKIGWFKSVIGLFVFVYILNNQIKCFRLMMNDIINDSPFNCYLSTKEKLVGILSGCIGIVVLCIYEIVLFGGEGGEKKIVFWIIVSIIAALQILQAVVIYKELRKLKLLISTIYLICVFATIVVFMYFMALIVVAIIVIIVWIGLYIFGKVQQSGRSSSYSTSSYESEESNVAADCRSCSRYPGHAKYCDAERRHVSDFRPTQACNFYRF